MAIELEISAPITVSGETTATEPPMEISAPIGTVEITAGISIAGEIHAPISAMTIVDAEHRLPDEPPTPGI